MDNQASNVVYLHIHHWARCTNKECTGCSLCHGGLSVCTICGGAEGSLPTDCPGERMTPQQINDVYAGELDWQKGTGWVKKTSKYSPGAA